MQNNQESPPLTAASEANISKTTPSNGSLYFAIFFAATAFMFVLVAMSAHWVYDSPNKAALCVIVALSSAACAANQVRTFIKSQVGTS